MRAGSAPAGAHPCRARRTRRAIRLGGAHPDQARQHPPHQHKLEAFHRTSSK
ncbi:hypothetical protein AMB3_3536 [plant metagenome]